MSSVLLRRHATQICLPRGPWRPVCIFTPLSSIVLPLRGLCLISTHQRPPRKLAPPILSRLLSQEASVPPSRLKKVLVIGSGVYTIGKGGEFGYICSQCVKALKHEGIEVVLIDANLSSKLNVPYSADRAYSLPATPYYTERIIEKERPDGIVFTFSGGAAEATGLHLHRSGVLSKYNVKTFGTPVSTIELVNDRGATMKALKGIGVPVPESLEVRTLEESIKTATSFEYPVIVRYPYRAGAGTSPMLVRGECELEQTVSVVLSMYQSAIIEKSFAGWKEVQYQVMRDTHGDSAVVSGLESINPLGIHTGDSIIVTPLQTPSEEVRRKLLDTAMLLAKYFQIVGLCDVKFALDQITDEFVVIEFNPVPSRSSVIASKAVGCHMASIATKLALGGRLREFKNANPLFPNAKSVPNTNNMAIKFPVWDFDKFKNVSRVLGPSMKSTGEAISIGCCFEEALQKAIRMANSRFDGLEIMKFSDIDKELTVPTCFHIFAIASAMVHHEYSLKKIHELTSIDMWFLEKIKNIVDTTVALSNHRGLEVANPAQDQPYGNALPYSGEGYFQPPVCITEFLLPQELLRRAKGLGFSDKQIAKITNSTEARVRSLRHSKEILPKFRSLDSSPFSLYSGKGYIYATYSCMEGDEIEPPAPGSIMVIGAGAYRIGSGAESDWCALSCTRTLHNQGKATSLINCNPGALLTNEEAYNFLFFEEPTFERVMDIYEFTKAGGCILSVGGQMPQIISLGLHNAGVKILGTSPVDVDRTEDREKFSRALDSIGIGQPKWKELTTQKEALAFAESVSYPVVVRPSYVISGTRTGIAYNGDDLISYLNSAVEVSHKCPVVLTKFMENCREFDLDAVSYEGKLAFFAICQHVEDAGIHSGDATLVSPPYFDTKPVYTKTVDPESVADSDSVIVNPNILSDNSKCAYDNQESVCEGSEVSSDDSNTVFSNTGTVSGNSKVVSVDLKSEPIDSTNASGDSRSAHSILKSAHSCPVFESGSPELKASKNSMWHFPQKVLEECEVIATKIAKEFNITGVFNMQMILKLREEKKTKAHEIKVLECNIKSSRTLPLVSKAYGRDLIEMATLAMLKPNEFPRLDCTKHSHLCSYIVRVPIFSWSSLKGADQTLGTEMKSTGEAACISRRIEDAYALALLSNNKFNPDAILSPQRSSLVFLTDERSNVDECTHIIGKYHILGYKIISGTEHTTRMLSSRNTCPFRTIEECLGITESDKEQCEKATGIPKKLGKMNIAMEFYKKENVAAVVSMRNAVGKESCDNCLVLGRSAIDCGIHYIYSSKTAALFADSILSHMNGKSWDEDILSLSEWGLKE